MGLKVIPMEKAAGIIPQVLARNEILALLIDQPLTKGGGLVRYFGHLVRLPGGIAALALRSGARVVPGAAVRLPGDTFLGIVDSPIPFEPSGRFREDVQALTQRIVSSLENVVRQYPDQWFMFRQMWVA